MNEESGRMGSNSNKYEYLHHSYSPAYILVQKFCIVALKGWILTICQSKIWHGFSHPFEDNSLKYRTTQFLGHKYEHADHIPCYRGDWLLTLVCNLIELYLLVRPKLSITLKMLSNPNKKRINITNIVWLIIIVPAFSKESKMIEIVYFVQYTGFG